MIDSAYNIGEKKACTPLHDHTYYITYITYTTTHYTHGVKHEYSL